MGLKLYIDLDKCLECEEENCTCSYNFHPENLGVLNLREMASFAIICRKCEDGTCVKSCPKEALEKKAAEQDGTSTVWCSIEGDVVVGVLKRYNMRCIGCKSCTLACPFGTIIPEFIPYKVSSCDYCIGRLRENEIPVCVTSCPINAIKYGKFNVDESKCEYSIGDNLIARAYAWDKVTKRVPTSAKK